MIVIVAAVALLLFAATASAKGSSAPGFDSIQDMIRATAQASAVDPALMLAIAEKESSFDPSAVNPSDPSYGLFQIQTFWLATFGFPEDPQSLLEGQFNCEIACRIIQYFQGRGYSLPDQVDVYNVGETNFRKGRRNIAYRDAVVSFYRTYNA